VRWDREASESRLEGKMKVIFCMAEGTEKLTDSRQFQVIDQYSNKSKNEERSSN
jgi:hypothetical protein